MSSPRTRSTRLTANIAPPSGGGGGGSGGGVGGASAAPQEETPGLAAKRALDALRNARGTLTALQREQMRAGLRLITDRPPSADYDMLGNLGSGSFGVVSRVRERASSRRDLCSKTIVPSAPGLPENTAAQGGGVFGGAVAPAVCRDAEATRAIYQEVEMMRRVSDLPPARRCPYVLTMIDAYETSPPDAPRPSVTVITELCRGGDLLTRVLGSFPAAAGRPAGECMLEADVAGVLRCVALALKHLHSLGIVHRDVKLENILLRRPAPEAMEPVLADLGLVAVRGRSDPHLSAARLGTLLYNSPEANTLDRHDYTEAGDVWALGIVAYVMLMAQYPFGPRDGRCASNADRERMLRANSAGDFDRGLHGEFAALSEGARDFVQSLLTVEPIARPTIDDVIAHPWLLAPPSGRRLPRWSMAPEEAQGVFEMMQTFSMLR